MKRSRHWETKNYYELASRASQEPHPGMDLLYKLARQVSSLVDLGCGEGTRLYLLARSSKVKNAIGIDISKTAIASARKRYKSIKFINGDLERLPLASGIVDLVYSAFVLEHTDDTDKVLSEAVRITKKGGSLVLIAPNYGAPNRSSPPFRGSRVGKLIKGFLNDFLPAPKNRLSWRRVRPIVGKYEMDYDVTVEPYIGPLLSRLDGDTNIAYWSTCWSEEMKARFHQKVFRFLGERGIYPFAYWGPHLLVHAVKK